MEDFVTWTDTSKIRRHLMEYNNEVKLHVLPLTVVCVALNDVQP